METVILPFSSLSVDELYELLRIRAEVFQIEQESLYLDVDGKDPDAMHLICREGGRMVGLMRILKPGTSFREASLGRIIAVDRGRGVGTHIVEQGIAYVRDVMGESAIRIAAQVQALLFYERFGFVEDGEQYDDGGVPHVQMVLRL